MNKAIILWLGFVLFFLNSCTKDDDTAPVKDVEGNVYNTISIGTQVWMAENLKTTQYRNGDPITEITDIEEWDNLSKGACCDYDNKPGNGSTYGKLYNWYAVDDNRNIAPEGWHVPTAEEWNTLETYIYDNLETDGSVAKALASKNKWMSSTNENAIGNGLAKNNTSGFTALPGGYYGGNGTFYNIGKWSYWWSSSESYPDEAFARYLCNDVSLFGENSYSKGCGFYIRCVKD